MSSDAGSVACSGRQRDTDGGTDLHRHAVEDERLLQDAEQSAGEVDGPVGVDGPGDEHRELVAAEPGDGAGRADDALEPERRPP